MCPGSRPATGWMPKRTLIFFARSRLVISLTTPCACDTAMPYPGTMTTSFASMSMPATSSDVVAITSPCGTAADVRFAFGKYGGSLGTPGSVAWMFERKGVITVPVEAADEDTITLSAAEGGAEDVRQDGDTWVITSEPHDFPALRAALEEAGIPMETAGLSLLPTTQVEVDAEQARTLLRLVDALEESDDVQDVYFNFDIPDAVLADA